MSNDRPDRPLQMPPASSETKEAFDDFDRFARRGAWERASKALYAIPEAQAARFVDGPDGFIISVARKRRSVLSALSSEGQAAYRLFYDSDAKKLLDQAEGATEQATLERLFSSYFLTSVGDNAADRLGDLYYERGEFDRAADCWLALLRERPDSELPPALTTVKAALALARAGRRSELEALRAEMGERYADEVVTIAGRKAKAGVHLGRIAAESGPAADAGPASSAGGGPAPELAEAVAAAWQVKFAASVTAGMTPVELSQWEATSFSGAVPATAVEGQTLFANYLGHVFAVDLASGKLLWRSASFHNLEQATTQGQSQMIETNRFAILAASGRVWTLGRDVKDPNYQAEFRLACRRAENGDLVWQSSDLSDYAGIDFVGPPLLARDTLFIAGKSSTSTSSMYGGGGQDGQPRQYVLAIRPRDGKLLWKTEVGIFREGERYYWYYGPRETNPQPRLLYRAGSVYVDTHSGILARLDADSGAVDWGYGYETDPSQSQSRFIIIFDEMPQAAPSTACSGPLLLGDLVLIKGLKSDRICAIDPDRMKLAWERPIAKSARLLGVDDATLYLGGPELAALDLKGRSLRWTAPLPGGCHDGRLLVRRDGLWQLTPRGIFEVDPQTGRVRRIFRGQDTGAEGGDLILTDRLLVAISNRTISAYPRRPPGAEKIAREGTGSPRMRGAE
ncbi:outer membrane protein assembly factor BamB family protein [Aquisphaera giovannonii]|nr:PQQ-binding-like beta-propeller repeat protein [Aquisphaera giovannonii]